MMLFSGIKRVSIVSKSVRIILIVLAILVVTGVVLTATGIAQMLMFRGFIAINSPGGSFDPGDAAPAPDYNQEAFWSALPTQNDPSDLTPEGIEPRDPADTAPADVFFIHPTGYLSGASWTSPMNPDSAAEENTRWMMAHQASAYNGCCNVYAPRYREATIYAYMGGSETRDAALGFAYQDVVRAFEHFIEHYNEGRPFILASHSQGSHHLKRLLREKIDGTPLFASMVAAYAIGSVMIEYSEEYFESLQQVKPCRSALETGCVVHWDTYAEDSEGVKRDKGSLCTNPLTWEVNNELANARLNLGAVPILVPYNLNFGKSNEPAGVSFDRLEAPVPGRTWAHCRNDTLFVADQGDWGAGGMGQGGSYHGLDYALFYMNIRTNATDRVRAWLDNNPTTMQRGL